MKLVAKLQDAVIALCKASFRHFVKRFWDVVPGAAPLKWNWHMDALCDMAQSLAERVFAGLPKLADYPVNVPPGTSKSSLLSILFPAWLWTRMPECRIICASHTSELVLDLAVKSRAVINSPQYQSLFPLELTDDVDTKGLYRNTHGGDRYSCTVAGKSPIGFHAHIIIIDDPLDPKKSLSEVEVAQARHFMEEVIESRKVDKAVTPTLLVMQRLGVGDPTDVMLEGAKRLHGAPVEHYCFPSELTDDVKPVKYREKYVDGLLDPGRMPLNVLQQICSRNAYAYSTQYLQKPMLPGGGMFKTKYFTKTAKAAPYEASRVFYVDRASSIDPGACYTAGVLMARCLRTGDYYVEDVIHGRWEPDERNDVLRAAIMGYRRRYAPRYEPKIWVEAEGGSSGRDAWKGMVKAFSGFAVREDRVTGSKDLRAEPWSTACAAGIVWLVDNGASTGNGTASWDINGFIKEHERFKPDVTTKRLGGLKDRVDACSGAYNILSDSKPGNRVLRVIRLGEAKSKAKLKVIATWERELESLVIDAPTLLVCIDDHGSEPRMFGNSLNRLISWSHMAFDDVDLSQVTDWKDSPENRALSSESSRKTWGFLTKSHNTAPECVIFCGKNAEDKRPLSLAYAFIDGLGMKRDGVLLNLDGEELHGGAPPPNQHCYALFRSSRVTS